MTDKCEEYAKLSKEHAEKSKYHAKWSKYYLFASNECANKCQCEQKQK